MKQTMNKARQATESDFRKSEFIDAKVEDYEVRVHDGAVVRKDRFEKTVHTIASMLKLRYGEWECDEVVVAVHLLKSDAYYEGFCTAASASGADDAVLSAVDHKELREFIHGKGSQYSHLFYFDEDGNAFASAA